MAIATTLKAFLNDHHVDYDIINHPYSRCSLESAHLANVPSHQVAKAVVLEDDEGYIVSVMPSNNRLDIDWVNESTGRKLEMAQEDELVNLFQDCELGAVPALGNAYGIDVIWDEQLTNASEIYIEAGDHRHLIHLGGGDFCKLMETQPHNIISAGHDYSRWISN